MNRKIVLAVLTALLIFALIVTAVAFHLLPEKTVDEPDAFIGVDVGYGDAETVYNVSDAVSGYANLIIIGSTDVTANTTELTKVCDYLYQKGFYFIVYVGFGNGTVIPPTGPNSTFFQMANNRWGTKFLGAYIFDEAGGKQLDLSSRNPDRPAPLASNFSDVAMHYIINIQTYLSLYKNVYYSAPQMKVFTSDYALYWYDYCSSYDVIFAEFLGDKNQNQIAVSLNRGAAESLGKEWGAILTFGPSPGNMSHISAFENVDLYDEMLQAWQNDARYIVVFDAPGVNHTTTTPYGVLKTEDLNDMKNFWNYAQTHQRPERDSTQTAYVLPMDYGYGLRGPNDTIWGLWSADALSAKIWSDVNSLLTAYGLNMDIVYETKTDGIPIDLRYKTLIYWNGTTIQT